MPRRALPSTSVLARIRAWFGLQQQELALYLGVTQQLVQGIEAGNRKMSTAVAMAMLPLARQLPEPLTRLQEPLPATLPPPVRPPRPMPSTSGGACACNGPPGCAPKPSSWPAAPTWPSAGNKPYQHCSPHPMPPTPNVLAG
ncbi:helix-turn-helix transcriptional regulator [Hymenobacter lutimineralis]|nr:helix-turn-helix transcriptional regulator [Hymenobacter lutimineralis]